MTKLKQKDLILDPKIKKAVLIEKEQERLERSQNKTIDDRQIPQNYYEFKLDSVGKLSAPKTLHFRDYTLTDLLSLNNHLYDEKYLDTLIKVINDMVYEDFDCGEFIEEEMIEILLSIHKRFHSNQLTDIPYYLDESILDLEIKNGKSNIGYADIDLRKIKTTTINSKFKEPFGITIDDETYYFTLSRLNNGIYAKNFAIDKYFEQERNFSDLKETIRENNTIKNPKDRFEIPAKDLEGYKEMLENKANDLIMVSTAMTIYGKLVDGKVIKFTDKNKIKEYPKVSRHFWNQYIAIKTKYCKFGIDNKVEFYSSEFKKPIIRSLAFQFLDFIPNMESCDDSEIDVSFGISDEED